MATATRPRSAARKKETRPPLPPLEQGDRLDQKTFHARYEAMGPGVRAELIGGVVIMPSPAKPTHGRSHSKLNGWLFSYESATPGVAGMSDCTAILGEESEPQPDSFLIVLPENGGQTRVDEDGYLSGAPELIAEASSSTESYDLHGKKDDYEKAGVCEYIVVALRQQRVFWFVRKRGKFKDLAPGPDGILQSEKFPGLWLDPAALLALDSRRMLEVLQQGLNTPEHAAFVKKLAAR